MHLGQDIMKAVPIPIILFNLQKSWSARRHKNQLREGQKMSSNDKTCCGRPIKRRCEIRPVDAVFSSENRPDYLSTLWGGTHTQQRKQSLCLCVYFMLFIYLCFASWFPFSPSTVAVLWHISLAAAISVMNCRWRESDGLAVRASLLEKISLRILPRRGWTFVFSQLSPSLTQSKGRLLSLC